MAQHGAVCGQGTETRATEAAGRVNFTFDDEDVPAAGERPEDVWPQEKGLQLFMEHVDAPSLDVPVLQVVEEVDDVSLVWSCLSHSQRWTMCGVRTARSWSIWSR